MTYAVVYAQFFNHPSVPGSSAIHVKYTCIWITHVLILLINTVKSRTQCSPSLFLAQLALPSIYEPPPFRYLFLKELTRSPSWPQTFTFSVLCTLCMCTRTRNAITHNDNTVRQRHLLSTLWTILVKRMVFNYPCRFYSVLTTAYILEVFVNNCVFTKSCCVPNTQVMLNDTIIK